MYKGIIQYMYYSCSRTQAVRNNIISTQSYIFVYVHANNVDGFLLMPKTASDIQYYDLPYTCTFSLHSLANNLTIMEYFST